MKVDLDSAILTSQKYLIDVYMDDGRMFLAIIEWSEFGGWDLEKENIIGWTDGEPTDDEKEIIFQKVRENEEGLNLLRTKK